MKKKNLDLINYYKNKTVLITGSNGVLGKKISNFFSSCKASLVLIDKDNENKNKKKNLKSEYFSVDFENLGELEKKIINISLSIKKIHLIINNATYTGTNRKWIKPFNQQTYTDWRNANKVNVDSIFIISKIFSNKLINNKGRIINIGSIFGTNVPNFKNYIGTKMNSPAAYSVSKNILLHMTKWLASNLAPNVNVNMISPGGIIRNQNKKFIKNYLHGTPLNRMCTEDDIIKALIFLSCNYSDYITGQNIIVDGGYSIL